ncbi:hypothetical protein CLV68_0786 [Actinokineospora cianjurensis]|uniref:Uncharacterized protein n=1 Tax=Actinokineospora cianjurensis TaxID=585224 RepID=A0A421B7N3_9PSEU|nr:hypothetical protein CLV68_0786 [Actinokineospora cianjurensis]
MAVTGTESVGTDVRRTLHLTFEDPALPARPVPRRAVDRARADVVGKAGRVNTVHRVELADAVNRVGSTTEVPTADSTDAAEQVETPVVETAAAPVRRLSPHARAMVFAERLLGSWAPTLHLAMLLLACVSAGLVVLAVLAGIVPALLSAGLLVAIAAMRR